MQAIEFISLKSILAIGIFLLNVQPLSAEGWTPTEYPVQVPLSALSSTHSFEAEPSLALREDILFDFGATTNWGTRELELTHRQDGSRLWIRGIALPASLEQRTLESLGAGLVKPPQTLSRVHARPVAAAAAAQIFSMKMYQNTPYRVVRTMREHPLQVADLPALLVDYVATNGRETITRGDLDARVIRSLLVRTNYYARSAQVSKGKSKGSIKVDRSAQPILLIVTLEAPLRHLEERTSAFEALLANINLGQPRGFIQKPEGRRSSLNAIKKLYQEAVKARNAKPFESSGKTLALPAEAKQVLTQFPYDP